MANLRDMLDGKTLEVIDIVAATAAVTGDKSKSKSGSSSKSSPLAKHISERMQDPVGATKDDFGALSEAKLNYDMAREKTQRNLAPVQAVITHLSQMHNLDPNQPPMPGGMDPNDPMADQNGGNNMFQDEQGNPVNMGNTAGKMNQTRPSLVGNQPGVAPGDGQTVRPPKLGQAQPGGPGARNSPAPGNAQGNTYNKTAAKPKGNSSLPGAKGPGDPKNVSKNRKAQSGTAGRQIKVNVSAQALDIMASATYANQESSLSLGVLKTGSPAIPVGTVLAGGPGSGRRPYAFGSDWHQKMRTVLKQHGFKDTGGGATGGYDAKGKWNDGRSRSDYSKEMGNRTHTISLDHNMGTWSHHTFTEGRSDREWGKHRDRAVDRATGPKGLASHLSGIRASFDVDAMMMPSRGGSPIRPSGGGFSRGGGTMPTRGGPVRPTGGIRLNAKKKKMEAGPAALADKVTDNPGDEVAYNPVIRSKSVGRPGPSSPRPKGSGAKPHRPGIAGPSGKNMRLPQPSPLKS